jgi:UDP-N-acetylmuramoyl-tripeptide--D-alanyl-D-alanine ligase
MMMLEDICDVLQIPCVKNRELTGICIDSRELKPGHLFVAIKGERFDGHQFIAQAASKGAAAVICMQTVPDCSIPQLQVPDTVDALARIATAHRQGLSCQVVALTGSNGKTTVKEMVASILPQPSFATPGNLNNHIGVPLSVLQLQTEHRYAVFELGANHLGEIAHTVDIVKPQVTLINNIAPAHIGEFGSIEGVARAKGEIHHGLALDGTAVINDDDTYAHYWDSILANKKSLRFSITKATDIHALDIRYNAEGCGQFTLVLPAERLEIQLQVPGAHNVSNALAAAACTYALGIPSADIAAGLGQFMGVSGRMTFLQGKHGALVIDDTYNANLNSTLRALDVLAQRGGRRVFVFGDMGELGEWSKAHHHEVGEAARHHGIELLMTCGQHSEETARAFGDRAKHYHEQHHLVQDLLQQLDAHTTVLVKGSRSSRMEKIVHELVV